MLFITVLLSLLGNCGFTATSNPGPNGKYMCVCVCVFFSIDNVNFLCNDTYLILSPGFEKYPQNQTVVYGPNVNVNFPCKYPGYDHTWNLNGDDSQDFLNRYENVQIEGNNLTIKGLNETFNNLRVTCEVLTHNQTIVETSTAVLTLQGIQI